VAIESLAGTHLIHQPGLPQMDVTAVRVAPSARGTKDQAPLRRLINERRMS
jgi:hypothetical protein